jgi:AmiR/NasT family two-component response regulator
MAHILIVEDDRLVLSGLADGLEMFGYTVARASSGEEALAMLDTVKPDLVVMDACLPGISGIETAKQIQQCFGIPVIFLSAYDDPQTVRDAIALGGLSYLVKPITVKQLVPAIESALARASDISKLKEQEGNLATALKHSRELSVAIGVLIERHGISAEEAFEALHSHARNTRRKARDVAQDFLAGSLQLVPTARARPKKR